jgi:hypothetical protein
MQANNPLYKEEEVALKLPIKIQKRTSWPNKVSTKKEHKTIIHTY